MNQVTQKHSFNSSFSNVPHKVLESYALLEGVSLEVASKDFEELCKFLDVSFACKTISVPSKKIDGIWHDFILHTKEYFSFCDKSYGTFMHHSPDRLSNKPMEDLQKYNSTRIRMELAYGSVDDKYWPDLQNRFDNLKMSCCENTNCMSDCH